jgi:RHS repeat-associated protein
MPQNPESTSPEGARQETSEFIAPAISRPQGGGALRGIDEKFASNPVTGAGALSVPIAVSKGRSGFGPQLALSYDSSGGNGPFGFGWNLSLPSITRRTDLGLPRYADREESDIFILSGSEDLVPVLVSDEEGRWIEEPFSPREGYAIKSYRPRTEALFARIERWTRCDDGATHWRSVSRDNILTLYGFDANSRIVDPHNSDHVFSWLICCSIDDKGNAMVYDYAEENAQGVTCSLASELHREQTANRYLQRIRYGNRVPVLSDPAEPDFRRPYIERRDFDASQWLFSLVLDYGEGRYEQEEPDADGRIFAQAYYDAKRPWAIRRDPFSSFRPCFELRTNRLCRRALMFHHFPEELGGQENYLVRSTSFRYDEKPIGSFLKEIKQSGHSLSEDGRYLVSSLPTLDLSYTLSPLENPDDEDFRIRDVNEENSRNLPTGIDGSVYRFLDLDGIGISGVLTEQDEAWLYKPNLGEGRFGETEAVRLRPALTTLGSPSHRLMDLAGDGNLDFVDLSSSSPGFYERNTEGGWEDFRAFRSIPVLNWSDPNLRFVDVTGDGLADILITEDDAFKWHPSLLSEGFGNAVRVHIPLEEEAGPRAIFADGTQSMYLADMTGDGLSDIVRIRNGEICYWPNLGYGRFGAKVTMDRSPWFDMVDLFDQRRIRLADTDGSGTSDILYLGHSNVEVFLNETGNSWSDARRVEPFPSVDNLATVDVMDLLGRGTACLVWSSPLLGDHGRRLRFLDLMCGRKPHLLDRVVNHAGSDTRIEYSSSTEFYLADQATGMPWVTKLPFPVHVVKRVETFDEVSRNRFVSRYTYHHGFYDGLEREFRGFGRVDQLDTEDIASLMAPGIFPTGDNMDAQSSVPPMLTRTWTHTGVFLDSGQISRHMAQEYFPDDAPLDDTIIPPRLTPFEAREACRALKGSKLRQEVYGLDGTAKAQIPYTVTENNFTIRTLQRLATNRHPVFFTHPREAITFHYERSPDDPRVGHMLTLSVDDYGNVLTSASIGYARRKPMLEEQKRVLATLSESQYTNAIRQPDAYRSPIPAQVSTYELTAPELQGARALPFDLVELLAGHANEIPYDAEITRGTIEKRLIERQRTVYRKNDLEGLLPLGCVESLALSGESYKLALTRGLLSVFASKATHGEMRSLLDGAQYRDLDQDGSFWIPSGRAFYSPKADDPAAAELAYARAHFFMPHRYRDPFDNATVVAYDEKYNLSLVYTRDAARNETSAKLDYRVLQPTSVIDPNGNRAEACFDTLGMLTGTALRGKAIGPVEGDSFDHFVADLTPSQVKKFFDLENPYALASEYLGTATTRVLYDLKQVPMCAATIARQTHNSDLVPGERSRIQLHFVYSDGFGREAQTKLQSEPGPLDPAQAASPVADPRWVGSGAKIYNNKGKPVREYEPFFSSTPHFGIEKWGVSNTLFYDPVLRVVATLHPNHTYEKAVFDAWKQITFDVNDTVTFDPQTDEDVSEYFRRLPDSDYLPTWYQQRSDGVKGPHERIAAVKASKDADTPSVAHTDSLGRTILSVADNGGGQHFRTRSVLDIEGNQRAVIDPLDRVVVRYDYDLLGTQIRQASMEAGERWMLNDVAGKPVRVWNSRGFGFRTEYDPLHRPVKSYVKGDSLPREILFERTIYGESDETGLSEAQRTKANLRGKAFRHFDDAGVLSTDLYDFKGNPLRSARRFTREYKHTPDWSEPQPLKSRTFLSTTKYDALNRTIAVTAPDGSIYRPRFNEANLLQAVEVNLRGSEENGLRSWTPFISCINYDAKGQRTICRYANSLETTYKYDEQTFRLLHLKTTRTTVEGGRSAKIFKDPTTLQDLHYTYDPIGDITLIADGALKTIFHDNQQVDAESEYSYDAIYRLIEATGREHVVQTSFNLLPEHADYRDYPFEGAAQMKDMQALQHYTERYVYDPAGNFLRMFHRAAHHNWNRAYSYSEPSLLEPEKHCNRLSETALDMRAGAPSERYRYDVHGNMTRMPHLPSMRWNYKDQLSATSRQTVNEGEPATTYYVYDASGQRARKVTEDECGKRSSERFYVSGFEVFREFVGGEVAMERETLHIMDDKQRIALVETKTIEDGHGIHGPTPEQRYQLSNHLGSASVEVDEAGGLITYEEYSPYGDTTFQAGISGAEVRRKRFRYTAKERDQENGFTYHGARYYAPWLGRWTSTDPKGITAGYNLYAYCDGRPTTKVDPDGMDPTDNGAPPPPVTFGLTFDSNGLRTDGFVVGLGRAGMGGSYMDRAQNNTGLISINIQDRINFARGVGSHFPSSFQVEQDFLKPDGENLFPMFSGVMVQEALEGKAAGAIHADTRGVNLVPPLSPGTLPGLSGDDFHSSSELRQIIAHIASTDADERKVDIFLQHDEGISYLPKGSNQIQGAPLPSHLADRVPNINNAPGGTSGTPGGGSSGAPKVPLIGPPSPLGGAATTLTRSFVPGVSELESSLQGVSQLAYQFRLPLVGGGLATAANAVPVAGAGLAVGGIAGTVTEEALLKAGADRDTAAVAGLGAAIYAGVRIGALVGAPFEGIGAVPGAIIGGIAGAIGFALFR